MRADAKTIQEALQTNCKCFLRGLTVVNSDITCYINIPKRTVTLGKAFCEQWITSANDLHFLISHEMYHKFICAQWNLQVLVQRIREIIGSHKLDWRLMNATQDSFINHFVRNTQVAKSDLPERYYQTPDHVTTWLSDNGSIKGSVKLELYTYKIEDILSEVRNNHTYLAVELAARIYCTMYLLQQKEGKSEQPQDMSGSGSGNSGEGSGGEKGEPQESDGSGNSGAGEGEDGDEDGDSEGNGDGDGKDTDKDGKGKSKSKKSGKDDDIGKQAIEDMKKQLAQQEKAQKDNKNNAAKELSGGEGYGNASAHGQIYVPDYNVPDDTAKAAKVFNVAHKVAEQLERMTVKNKGLEQTVRGINARSRSRDSLVFNSLAMPTRLSVRDATAMAAGVIPPTFEHRSFKDLKGLNWAIYLDVSGSVSAEIPLGRFIAKQIHAFGSGNKMFVFSSGNRPLSFDGGNYIMTTGGTAINPVLEHAYQNKFRKVCLITDCQTESIDEDAPHARWFKNDVEGLLIVVKDRGIYDYMPYFTRIIHVNGHVLQTAKKKG